MNADRAELALAFPICGLHFLPRRSAYSDCFIGGRCRCAYKCRFKQDRMSHTTFTDFGLRPRMRMAFEQTAPRTDFGAHAPLAMTPSG